MMRPQVETQIYKPEADGYLYYASTKGECINYSREADVDFSEMVVAWAVSDIQPGEEPTGDFRYFMADASHITYLKFPHSLLAM